MAAKFASFGRWPAAPTILNFGFAAATVAGLNLRLEPWTGRAGRPTSRAQTGNRRRPAQIA